MLVQVMMVAIDAGAVEVVVGRRGGEGPSSSAAAEIGGDIGVILE